MSNSEEEGQPGGDRPYMLSVLIPVYNEREFVRGLVEAVLEVPFSIEREVMVVDDGSTDGTADVLSSLDAEYPAVSVFYQPQNRGKGAALHRALAESSGNLVIVQDADQEYDPQDIPMLLKPILEERADVVYGTRFAGGGPHRVLYFWHSVGNRFLTLCSNMMTNINLTDMEVCYKLFRRSVLDAIELREEGFGFEVEVTAKVARGGWRIYEVPISYHGREYAEGKKITWRDGIKALWFILKYRFSK